MNRDKGQGGKGQGKTEITAALPLQRRGLPESQEISIFMTVAEPSADQHAAYLITQLRALRPDIQIHAIGGEKMRQAGAIIHYESVANAAMGWRAALRAREVAGWLKWTDRYFTEHKPALHICCDSWSMNWRFARLAHHHGIPVLYYIAPQTWASREGRVNKLRRYVTKLACILPFEEQYFRQHQIDATYVGHPLFDELLGIESSDHLIVESLKKNSSMIQCSDDSMIQSPNAPHPNPPPEYQGREQKADITVGLLPGSRSGIARQNFPHQLKVAKRILKIFPHAQFLVPTTAVTHDVVSALSADFPNLRIDLDGFDCVVPQCDFCLSVSGTAALHIAAYGVPFIIVYRVPALHWHLVGRWIVKARTYSLVNILSGKKEKIVPEFIPWYGSNKPVADAVIDYLKHPAKAEAQRCALQEMLRPIARPGAAANVAKMALEMIQS